MKYEPQVNDYVIWNNDKGLEGWVYFKCDDYITIETSVWQKNNESYIDCPLHRNDRVLVLCYKEDWIQLKYIKSRESIYEI